MILFIHGFASCGLGRKSRLLIARFGKAKVLTPNLPHAPRAAADLLEQLLATHPVDLLVGSSLGGYYATWLQDRHDLPAVLINPAVRPWQLLDGHVGSQTRWCDSAPFEFTEAHVDELRTLYIPQPPTGDRTLVLLQRGDETLDYRDAADYYRDNEVVIEDGGNHRFDNLADHLDTIGAMRATAGDPA